MSGAAAGGMRSGAGAARLLSDDRLARRAIEGDQRAFSAIYRRYHQSLYRFCLAIVGNSQDAQDALQNTMVKVLQALPGEPRQIELKPWLYRIAHNESVELLRRRRGTDALDPELATPGSGLAEEAELRERLRRLISDLDQLPERQRGALVMRELAGLDFAEIATALGTSPAVVRQTLYEARLNLRQMDEGREMTCATVTRTLSDADGRVTRRRDIRAHLRACPDCRRFRDDLAARRRDLAALSPLPAAASAGLLHGILGAQGGSGGGLAGALGGGAAKSLGASGAIKSAIAVAAVAAVGVTAADRGGLIDVGPANGGLQGTRAHRSAGPAARVVPAGVRSPRSSLVGPGGGSAAARLGAARALGAPHATNAAADPTPAAGTANGEAPSLPSPQGASGVHPHGRGHEKTHPAASAHGQQTAAGHKTASHGGGSSHSHSAHAAKPTHPSHPANAGSEKGASSTKTPGGPSSQSQPQPVSPDKSGSPPLHGQDAQNGASGTGRHEPKEER